MSSENAIPKSRRRGLWFKLPVAFVLAVFGLAGWLTVERQRGKAALKKYEQELLAKGEKLTFAELVGKQDVASRDAAIELLAASTRLQTGACLIANAPPPMRSIAPGKALVITKEKNWANTNRQQFTWENVAENLRGNQMVLDEIRRLSRSPRVTYRINYRGVRTMMPHLAPTRRAAQWFSASSLYHLHLGEVDSAIHDIATIVLLAKVFDEEPLTISQLVRIEIVAIAIENCWALLQHDGVSDAQLAEVQKLFDNMHFGPAMLAGLQQERIMGREALQTMRSGSAGFNAIIDSPRWGRSEREQPAVLDKLPYHDEMREAIHSLLIYPLWRRVFSFRDEKQLAVEIQKLIEALRSSDKNQSSAELHVATRLLERRLAVERTSWQQLGTTWFLPRIVPASMRSLRAQTHCELAKTAIALKRYHLRSGRYPATLAELVPDFLPTVPVDYIDGAPLRYKVEGATFLLWSIGKDTKHDVGSSAEHGGHWHSVGEDAVWPQAASEAEVKSYRAPQSGK